MIVLQFLREVHAIQVEDGRLILGHAMLALAVVEGSTSVWFHAVFGEVTVGLVIHAQDLQGLTALCWYFQVFVLHQIVHINDGKQVLDIQRAMPYIVAVEAHQISVDDFDPTFCEHPLLIGNVRRIFLQLCFLTITLREAATLHLVDIPSVSVAAQDIDGTVVAFEGEGSLTDVVHALVHILLRQGAHLVQVEAAVGVFCGHLLVGTKKSHGEVAHLIALLEAGFQSRVIFGFFGIIYLQPEVLRALAEGRVARF